METLSTTKSLRSICFKPSFFPKLPAIGLKKEYCHLLVEGRRWIFAQWKPQAQWISSVPHLALHPAKETWKWLWGRVHMVLPSSLSGQRIWTRVSGSFKLSSWCSGRRECICEDKRWQANSLRASHCLSLTHPYAEFPNSVSPHPNLGQQALA